MAPSQKGLVSVIDLSMHPPFPISFFADVPLAKLLWALIVRV